LTAEFEVVAFVCEFAHGYGGEKGHLGGNGWMYSGDLPFGGAEQMRCGT
jgi:hypothetical protein